MTSLLNSHVAIKASVQLLSSYSYLRLNLIFVLAHFYTACKDDWSRQLNAVNNTELLVLTSYQTHRCCCEHITEQEIKQQIIQILLHLREKKNMFPNTGRCNLTVLTLSVPVGLQSKIPSYYCSYTVSSDVMQFKVDKTQVKVAASCEA